jgi:uncharacterized surface protein with fasciclin (FAS1) repeats
MRNNISFHSSGIFNWLLLALLALHLVACGGSESPAESESTDAETITAAPAPDAGNSLVDAARASGQCTKFLELCQQAGLMDILASEPGPFTLLAPIDAAWAQPDMVKLLERVAGDADLLNKVLRNHVIEGKFTRAELAKQQLLQTISGNVLYVLSKGGEPQVDGVPIAAGEQTANNGILHTIPQVLVPKQ